MYNPIIIKVHNEQKRQFRAREHRTVSNQQAVSQYEEFFGRRPTDDLWNKAIRKDEEDSYYE